MGGWKDSTYRRNEIKKLAGKSNYLTQNPAVLMKLRANKVAKILTLKIVPVNPEDLEIEEINDKIKGWLKTQEEVPNGGFTTQKITRNRTKWTIIAQKEYDDQSEKNDVALAIIYNNYIPTCQNLIKDDSMARTVQERLKEAYSETGFSAVYA